MFDLQSLGYKRNKIFYGRTKYLIEVELITNLVGALACSDVFAKHAE